MKIKLLKYCLLFPLCCSYTLIVYCQQLTMDSIPLTWNDFLPVSDVNYRNQSFDAQVAPYIDYKIRLGESNQKGYLIEVHVALKNSRCKVDKTYLSTRSPNERTALLNHEKAHYIITIIHFKKFCKDVSNIQSAENINAKIKDLLIANASECSKIQQQYDKETKHGLIVAEQEKWESVLLIHLNNIYNGRSLHLKDTLFIPYGGISLQSGPANMINFVDHFDDNQNKWLDENKQADNITASIEDGFFTISNEKKDKDWTFKSSSPLDFSTDFEIEIKFKIDKGKGYKSGLLVGWGADDSMNNYGNVCMIALNGEMFLKHCEGGNHEECNAVSGKINSLRKNEFNIVTIQKIKEDCHVFLNGIFEKTITLKKPVGSVLFLGATRRTQISYDYIQIESL